MNRGPGAPRLSVARRRPRLALIGNGMAGARFLEELLAHAPDAYEITVFGEEPTGGYNRIMLGKVLAGGAPDDIVTHPPDWYAARSVRFRPGVTVARLDTDRRQVLLAGGGHWRYDVAVLATGSAAFVPDIPGARGADGQLAPGVHAFRTVGDAMSIRAAAAPRARAVVIGGGLLGLEAAYALRGRGVDVTLVHLVDTLMNAQLDPIGGRLLKRAMEALGVTFAVGETARIDPGAVSLKDGRVLPADLVVFAVGVRPRVDVARASGLAVGRAVLVDDRMATPTPGVHAIGECAEHAGRTYGLVAPCWEQAEVLARNLAAAATPGAAPAPALYAGSRVYTRLKVSGVDVASLGLIEAAQADDQVVQIVEERQGRYRKLITRGDRLVGAILVGDVSAAPTLIQALDRQSALPANLLDLFCSGEALLPATGGAAQAGAREVCNCNHVDEETIVACIREGCDSVEAVGARTRAGTGCGSCRGLLGQYLRRHATRAA